MGKIFDEVNEKVFNTNTDYEELQGLCIDLATKLEKAEQQASQLEPPVGKLLLSEIRKHYLVEIDIETGEPKADMKILMELWDKINKYLEIKTVG